MKSHIVLRATGAAAIVAVATMPLVAIPHSAAAQANPTLSNAVPESAAVAIHAKITAIDLSTRDVTLQGRSGTSVTLPQGR
jgi:hypothetical protein